MYDLICLKCNSPFKGKTSKQIYCSKQCYFSSAKRKPRTKDQKAAISKKTKEFYNDENLETNKKRWENIGKNKTKFFTKEELDSILKIYSYRYVVDFDSVLFHANIKNKSKKILENYVKNNKEWYNNLNLIKGLPKNIQKLPIEEILKIQEDSKILNISTFSFTYNISFKQIFSFVEKGFLSSKLKESYNNRKNTKETFPEKFVRNCLEENKIYFQKEYYLNNNGKRYYYDFCLKNKKIIEVHGDYWHVNPRVYTSEAILSKAQKENLLNDINKEKFLKELNYDLLIIWEEEIYKKPNEIKEKIKNYARKQV